MNPAATPNTSPAAAPAWLFDLTGVRVLVTGGTGGIGAALVEGFLTAGADVAVAARNAEAATLPGPRLIVADLAQDESIRRLVDEARAALGGIDVLVQAHGNVSPGPAVDLPLEDFESQLRVNLTATFRLAQAVAPEMIARKRGKIIHVASMLTFQGGLNACGYAAAKGGVGQLTKALSNEWAPHGVNVNAVAPGYVKTKLNRHVWSDPVRHDQVLARLPSGRWGEPADLIGPVLFLASPASDYVHGVILPVDGGWLAR